ncbi:MAG: hybrid sensor histidine kinase/response regulator [Desulfonatronovibrio sp. MSAO_Bac4]|nr:MAG: hybrid sensor histidine kinase/response regulator [Desulfonatronovibrio sp. MSAO_Bac4]
MSEINDNFTFKLSDLTVLCVEDEPFSLQYLTQILKPRVKDVYPARDGQEGLYSFSRFSPDIVITDIEMPRVNGLDMAQAIRQADPDSLIIVATAFDDIDYLKKAISLRLDEFISKPVNPEELYNALHRSLEKISIKNEQARHKKFTKMMLEGMPFPVMLVNAGKSRIEIANQVARTLGYDQGTSTKGNFFSDQVIAFMQEKIMPSRLFSSRNQEMVSLEAMGKSWDIYLNPAGPETLIFVAVDVTWRTHLEKLKEDVERITHHDMKTPLNGIIGIPDILLESPNLSEEEKELVTLIRNSGDTLLNMVNLSLDLYRMEQGSYVLTPEKVDVTAVLRQALSQLSPFVRGKNIEIKIMINGEPSSPQDCLNVMGEELLCYSMLSNLLKNALEASPAEMQVTINIEQFMDNVLISIHNFGVVPEEIKNKFFDKLTTSGKKSGTGLGTYSAQLMARTMNGHIEVETSHDYGTYLKVYLPLAEE